MSTKTHGWAEYTSPLDGRKYYYNSVTKESVWVKPKELEEEEANKLQEEDLTCDWKEFTAPDGRKYFYNFVTKASVWEMPPEYKEFIEKGGLTAAQRKSIAKEKEKSAEETFFDLLKESNVASTYTWEEAMRLIINHPSYQALKTVSERKQAFMKYVEMRKVSEREERKAKIDKVRQDFKEMLSTSGHINPLSTWRKVLDLFSHHQAFSAVESERERESLFEEYINEVRRKDKEEKRVLRRQSMDRFLEILKSRPDVITQRTRFLKAFELVKQMEEYKSNLQLQKMDMIDFLIVYEDFIKELEDDYYRSKSKKKEDELHESRKIRDTFRSLIQDYAQKGLIHAKTKWKDFYKMICNEDAFLEVFSHTYSGSNPLDLFFDFKDEASLKYSKEKSEIEKYLKEHSFVINGKTNYNELESCLNKGNVVFPCAETSIAAYFFEAKGPFLTLEDTSRPVTIKEEPRPSSPCKEEILKQEKRPEMVIKEQQQGPMLEAKAIAVSKNSERGGRIEEKNQRVYATTEDHIKEDRSVEEKETREERKLRHRRQDAFKYLLKDLRHDRIIHSSSTWPSILPFIAKTKEYQELGETIAAKTFERLIDKLKSREKKIAAKEEGKDVSEEGEINPEAGGSPKRRSRDDRHRSHRHSSSSRHHHRSSPHRHRKYPKRSNVSEEDSYDSDYSR